MLRSLIIILATLVVPSVSSAAPVSLLNPEVEPLETIPAWRSTTADICRDPETGEDRCPFTWALDRAGDHGIFPSTIQAEFAAMVAESSASQPAVSPETVLLCPGDPNVFMSFWRGKPVFYPEMSIALEECTEALRWVIDDLETGTRYELFRVLACGNVAGRATPLADELPELVARAEPGPLRRAVQTAATGHTGWRRRWCQHWWSEVRRGRVGRVCWRKPVDDDRNEGGEVSGADPGESGRSVCSSATVRSRGVGAAASDTDTATG